MNEPICGYESGTPQRVALEAKLKELGSKLHDIPIVIGDEEVRTKDVRYQLKVSELGLYERN